MIKIALAMICKPSDDEALLLEKCLENVSPHVDGIFITQAGQEPNAKVSEVIKKYNGTESFFKWINDFSAARNYNFSQVPKDYTHILWADADDLFRGLEKLRPTLEEHQNIDVFSMFYLYDFDEYKQATVVHAKTQVVKNNDCVKWAGELHEDFSPKREISAQFLEGIERIHTKPEKAIRETMVRNVEVARHGMKNKPNDPRSYWNLANSLAGNNEWEESKEAFIKFMEMSSSDEEKYIANIRLSTAYTALGQVNKARECLQQAIGIKPMYPDAYYFLGQLFFDLHMYDRASESILIGLTKKPPIYSIIVFNPRDYDYNPMMLLAKSYFQMSRPDLALPLLKGCLKIYPDNPRIKEWIKDMEEQTEIYTKVVNKIEELQKIDDDETLRKAIDELPEEYKQHPRVCLLRNQRFTKTESSGKDIAYYCGFTTKVWNPEIAEKEMVGGSEEAVINLSREWAKLGWNVTVYNNCGHEEKVYDGVTYKPFWAWNYRDKQDIVIIWRTPKPTDYNINADKIYIDLHDVIPDGEFTKNRLEKITSVFVKTKFHRSLFPSIPDEKISIVPNGMDFELFDQDIKKDPYLLVNTSSPDRSLNALPELFKRVKEKVPEAKCKWAYGWDIFDYAHGSNSIMMDWKVKIRKELQEAGIEELGRLTQKDAAKLYLEGTVLAYPSEFAEIDCISVKKAQACGCIPVTTTFGAFKESVKFGSKVKSYKTNKTWCKDNQFYFGIENEKQKQQWVDEVVAYLKGEKTVDTEKMKKWVKRFAWPKIAKQWHKIWTI